MLYFRPAYRFSRCLILFIFFCLPVFAVGGNETFYITVSGQKYHRAGCSALSRSRIEISLEEAVRSGYEPCAICRPPVMDIPGLYRVNRAGLRVSGDADITLMLRAEVIDHVDGDTIKVRISDPYPLGNPEGIAGINQTETIRLLGVDTPETVHPNSPVQFFGKEASDFTKDRLLGRSVFLAFDWDLRDRYGRLLAYVYTGAGNCFNAALVREGYAYAYLQYAFQFMDEFRSLEREARSEKRGLWRD